MNRMLTKNVTGARLLGLAAVLSALAIVSLSTRANASVRPHPHHGVIGQDNKTVSNHSPTTIKGFQNSAPISSGGQNSTMNASCRKAPCRISQKVNMLPWDVSAFIFFGPSDYLLIP